MPVIGTPSSLPVVQAVNAVTLQIPTTYDAPILSKIRAAVVQQAQAATFNMQIYDYRTLAPVDLTKYGLENGTIAPATVTSPSAMGFRFAEAVGAVMADSDTLAILDASIGLVSCTIPDAITANAGVYLCETGVFDTDGRLLFSNTNYILVDRGLYTITGTVMPTFNTGHPSLDEIRVSLKDFPESNRLIDTYEFDVADICEAMVKSVLYWNTTSPPISISYNTINFPWRSQWIDGISAYLYEAAATYYRRNSLKHQAGGLAIDDLNKEREYLQAWQIRNERWTKWVQQEKVSINMREGFGTFGSAYYYGPSSWNGGW